MPDRTIQVLLVDGKIEDSHWVRELLTDFGENRFGGGWMHDIQIFPLDRLADALTLMAGGGKDQFDAILLNPDLPDGVGLHSLLRFQACAPAVPILILADSDDQDLAMSMLRAGAQDFLAKNQLDSIPLARAIRMAVERNKTVRQLKTATWRDELTGLANRAGFDIVAKRELETARRLHYPLALLLAEVDGLDHLTHAYGKDERQLVLIESAEILRTCVGECGCLARVESNRFAVSLPGAQPAGLKILESQISRRFHNLATNANRSSVSLRQAVSWFHPGQRSEVPVAEQLAAAVQGLCENVGNIHLEFAQEDCHRSQYAYSNRHDL